MTIPPVYLSVRPSKVSRFGNIVAVEPSGRVICSWAPGRKSRPRRGCKNVVLNGVRRPVEWVSPDRLDAIIREAVNVRLGMNVWGRLQRVHDRLSDGDVHEAAQEVRAIATLMKMAGV